MRSIPIAMTWEILARGRWILIASLLGANLLPALILSALRMEGITEIEDTSQIVMHFVLVQINILCFAAGVQAAQGAVSRLFAFPVRTTTLVAWQMLPAMLLVAVESLASAATLNAVFDLHWPLWVPALFAAVAVTAIQAALWLTEKSQAWLPWAMVLVATALSLWFKSRYGETFSQPDRYWSEVTPLEVMSMLAFAGMSYSVAVVGVAWQRRGDALPSLGFVAWFERTFDSTPEVGQPFRTPAQAQSWFEWRQKGWAMPVAVVFLLFMGFGIWLLFNRKPQDLLDAFVAGGGVLSALGMVGGIILGNCGPNDSNSEMGQFLATRPMTTIEMSRTILKTAAKSVLLAWCIWAVAFVAVLGILWATHSVPPKTFPPDLGWWYFPLTLIGLWIVTGLLSSVALMGKPTLFLKLFAGLFLLIIARPLLVKKMLSYEAQLQLDRAIPVVLGVVFVLGTAWAFAAARRRSLMDSRTMWLALAAWTGLSMLVIVEAVLHSSEKLAFCVFTIGLLACAAAPMAAAPLALSRNRTR